MMSSKMMSGRSVRYNSTAAPPVSAINGWTPISSRYPEMALMATILSSTIRTFNLPNLLSAIDFISVSAHNSQINKTGGWPINPFHAWFCSDCLHLAAKLGIVHLKIQYLTAQYDRQ